MCEQHLAERVVQLVRTGVEQVFAFEPDLGARVRIAETARVVTGVGRPA